jgi:hypothetical protein
MELDSCNGYVFGEKTCRPTLARQSLGRRLELRIVEEVRDDGQDGAYPPLLITFPSQMCKTSNRQPGRHKGRKGFRALKNFNPNEI